ncbi:hypothetical protein DFH06DRAFT_1343135 [Mycena polygramma]|nr:hypothetical protein DFH06DRAFT_1343135 [Mycena polygramma]
MASWCTGFCLTRVKSNDVGSWNSGRYPAVITGDGQRILRAELRNSGYHKCNSGSQHRRQAPEGRGQEDGEGGVPSRLLVLLGGPPRSEDSHERHKKVDPVPKVGICGRLEAKTTGFVHQHTTKIVRASRQGDGSRECHPFVYGRRISLHTYGLASA